jgi:peptidyl-prolyl cis-trans isomerase C
MKKEKESMTLQVNGEIIPEEAVEYELKRLVKLYSEHLSPEELERQMDALRVKAREQAVGAKLLMLEARKLDLRVSEEDVDQRLAKMIENAGGEERFAAILQRQNLRRDSVRQNILEGRRVDLLVERIVSGTPDPTEADLRAHFEAHMEEYSLPEQVRAQHILIKPGAGDAERAVAQSRLLEIRARVEDGADFGDQAAIHSECPSGKNSEGSLGWIAKGSLLPQIEEVLFSMSTGDLSDVVETPLGFHLFMKTGREDRRRPDFEDVREKIRDFLRHAARGEAIAAYVRELREQANVSET